MTGALPTEQECQEWLAVIRTLYRSGADHDVAALRKLGICPISGGRNNAIYHCVRDGRACCVKVYRTDGRQRDEREWHALTFLATHLPGLAPYPFHYDPDGTLPMVAMEYVQGEPLLDLPLTDELQAALAEQLQRVYALTPAVSDFPYRAESAVPKIISRIEAGAATSPPKVRACLGRWLASADQASLHAPTAPVFGLADPNLMNWRWESATKTLRRVDLEYAGWCDLACELADLIEGPWARGLPDASWLAFARRFPTLDPERFAAAHRMFAHFWVGLFAERGDERLSPQIARATALLEEH